MGLDQVVGQSLPFRHHSPMHPLPGASHQHSAVKATRIWDSEGTRYCSDAKAVQGANGCAMFLRAFPLPAGFTPKEWRCLGSCNSPD